QPRLGAGRRRGAGGAAGGDRRGPQRRRRPGARQVLLDPRRPVPRQPPGQGLSGGWSRLRGLPPVRPSRRAPAAAGGRVRPPRRPPRPIFPPDPKAPGAPAVSTFYLLPPRSTLGDAFAALLEGFFPGLDWDTDDRARVADLLADLAQSRPDVYVLFRDDL